MTNNESYEIAVIDSVNALTVFANEGGSQTVIDSVRKQISELSLDISTDKGRDAIRSVAYKIARTKTAIDEQGKILKSELQKQVDVIDGERKKIRDALDEMKEDVRKPLTDWENAEKKRVQDREDRISVIAALAKFEVGPTVSDIQIRIDQLSELSSFDWQEFSMRASETISATKYELERALASRIKHDQDQEELERLRKEQAEREQKEREERIAREAAEKARKEAEEKAKAEAEEAARVASQREETERRAKEEAIRAAERAEAKRKADAEKAEADRKAAAERYDREKKEAAEFAARKERERIETEKRKADAEAAARESDKKHKSNINNEVLTAVMKFVGSGKSSEATAKDIVIAIASGKIPHTKITY